MPLHVHGYQKTVNGKLVNVGDYDSDRAAAAALEAKTNPDRPPMVATQGKFGMAPHGQMPMGRDVPGIFPEPPPVIDPLKMAHAAAAHAAIAAGHPTDPKTGHALPKLKKGQSLRVSTGNKNKWAVVEKGAVHHLIDKDSGAIEPVPKSWHASHAKGNLKEIAHGTDEGHTESPEASKAAKQAAEASRTGGAHDVAEGGHSDHSASGKDGTGQGSAEEGVADKGGYQQPKKAAAPTHYAVLTGDDVHDQESMTPDLSPDEVKAIQTYTGPHYPEINRILRQGQYPSNSINNAAYDQAIKDMQALFERAHTSEPILVHRGIAYAPWLPDKLATGSVITDKGLVSSTTDIDVANSDFAAGAGGVRFDISVPAGHPALSVKNQSGMADEQEVILPPGTQFKITSDAQDEDDIRVVKMEVVPIAGKDPSQGVSSTVANSLSPVKGMNEVSTSKTGSNFTVRHGNGAVVGLSKQKDGSVTDSDGNVQSPQELNAHRDKGQLFHGGAHPRTPAAKPEQAKPEPTATALSGSAAHQKSMIPKPTTAQGEALYDYVGPSYAGWNKDLRSGLPPEQVSEQLAQLDSLIAKAKVKQPIMVYRGVRTDQTDSSGNVTQEKWLPQLEPGTVLSDMGYVSTTSQAKVASTFGESGSYEGTDAGTIFEIHIPAGANALSVSQVAIGLGRPEDQDEGEVLLPRGSKFEVQSDAVVDGQRHVVMHLVMDAQGGLHEQDAVAASWPQGLVMLAAGDAGQLWLDAAQKGIEHVLLVVKNNPLKNLPEMLVRPDIQQALSYAGQMGAKAVEGAIVQKWADNGGPDGSAYLASLLADVLQNGNTFAGRMAAALATADHDQVRAVLERDRLRASAGESVAATKARTAAQLLDFAQRGVTQVRWKTRSGNPCKACLALEAGPPITIGGQFDPLAGGLNLPVYHDLTGPPRHPGCECELVEA